MSINILVADDHFIVTDGLITLIKNILPEAQTIAFERFGDAIKHLQQTAVQLVICDINMPGANHFGIVTRIKMIQPEAKLLILTAYSPKLYAHKYLREGADAYLSKNSPSTEIEKTILGLLSGDGNNQETGFPTQAEMAPLDLLSKRELEVAQLLIKGYGILEISNLLQLHVNTVSTYKTRIFDKTGILSIPELIELFSNYSD